MNWTFSIGTVALLALVPDLAGHGSPAYAHDALISKHAAAHGVPESLVRRVIHIESKGNPGVVSKGNYGLMQIRLGTARAMGYRGDAQGLLNADTNMTYAVRYLAGAYRAARGNPEQAIRNYQKGYYYSAKAQGFSPYAVASTAPVTQQASAPDPTMLPQDARREAIQRQQAIQQQQAVQQQAIQQQAIQQQAVQQQSIQQQAIQQQAIQQQAIQQALEQQQVAQRQAIEQQRAMQRQAALQAQIEQRQAAEQARIAQQQERNAQRQALLQGRIARQQAAPQERMARQQAMEQQRLAQRQAMLQQRIDREQDRQQQRLEREQARVQQKVEREQARAQQGPPSTQPLRRAAAAPSYAWYNPMRYFKHPSHQANPYRPGER